MQQLFGNSRLYGGSTSKSVRVKCWLLLDFNYADSPSDFHNYLGEAFDSEPDAPLWPGKYLLIAKGKTIPIRSQVIPTNTNELDWTDASDSSNTPSGSVRETSPTTSAKLLRDLLNSRELH